jgi:hypothetical protein
MDLRLCPACGQSVLDDDAAICPFCGGAMDGSGGPKRAPGAGKSPSRPATPGSASSTSAKDGHRPKPGIPPVRSGTSPAGSSKPPDASRPPAGKSESRPIQAGMKAGKTSADEDDPFDLGAGIQQQDVIQALAKPEKGRLHRVVCPMCEQPGFVAKNAIGRQVKCANPKCMVPVFRVPDPAAAEAERTAAARRVAVDAAEPRATGNGAKRNPLVFYGIVGAVLLVLTVGVSQYLNRAPALPADLNAPIALPPGGYGGNTDPVAVDPQPVATDVVKSPSAEIDRLVKRMIIIARNTSNRDKALARRMTGETYLRINQPILAAQEFAQLLTVNRQAGYYQIQPRLNQYWRHGGGLKAADLDQLLKDAELIPSSGRIALETVVSLATVLIAEGRTDAAENLLKNHQRDPTVRQNRDAMSSAAWFCCSLWTEQAGIPRLTADNVFTWKDPLRVAVIAGLASHRRWKEAVQWSENSAGALVVADSLAVVAEFATHLNASESEIVLIETAGDKAHPMVGLKVRSIIAAARKDSQRLSQCTTAIAGLTSPPPLSLSSFNTVLSENPPERLEPQLLVGALAEYCSAAVRCEDSAKAEDGIRRMLAVTLSMAPAVPEVRKMSLQIELQPDAVRKNMATELRLASAAEIDTNFRTYRRKIDRYAETSEEGRLRLIQGLARVIRSGGLISVQHVFRDDTSQLKTELMVDQVSGVLAVEAVRKGASFPELLESKSPLRIPQAGRATDYQELSTVPLVVEAWLLTNDGKAAEAVAAIERTTDLPGYREAALQEILIEKANRTENPGDAYSMIGAVKNPVWREDLLCRVGTIFGARNMETIAEKWLNEEARKMPPTEQVCALFGLSGSVAGRIDATASQEKK